MLECKNLWNFLSPPAVGSLLNWLVHILLGVYDLIRASCDWLNLSSSSRCTCLTSEDHL
ncbi:uncharacterized protein J3R85_011986 [Psidium guajava]|nr:uncharacterized protein J3R85_011986 [Psidium guajava]